MFMPEEEIKEVEEEEAMQSKLKCLVANDEEMQLTILEMLFQNIDFDVVTASNGHQAYEEVLARMQKPKAMFDLIILDINMPVSNGWEALKNIQNLFSKTKLFQADHMEVQPVKTLQEIGPILENSGQSQSLSRSLQIIDC